MNSLPVLYCDGRNDWIRPKMLLVVDNCATHPHLDFFFVRMSDWNFSQHHILGTASGHRNHKNMKTLYRAKLVNYMFEEIQELSSSTKETSARISHLLAAQFVADC
jgi:hypothetical protein